MYCAPYCGLPLSNTLGLLTCGAVTEPILKCRRLNAHWMAEERHWCLRNGAALRQLAIKLQRPLEQVCRFLYQLTLKKFGEILNPKCSHWNWYRVPFVRPDTCGLYDGIFDVHGNLRDPLHPYILHILLTILNHYLDLPCQGYTDRPYASMLDEICYGRSEGKCTDIFRADKDGLGAKLRQAWDESGLGYNFGGADFNPDGDDGKDGDGNDDGKNGERESIKDISNLYSRVVQDKHKRKLVSVSGDADDGSGNKKAKKPKPPKVPKKRRYLGNSDRRFLGKMLPVLVHEPFDDTKPWTWVRRHPMQTRVLRGTRIGRAKVHLYKRETLELQYQKAKQHYSTHSIYSLGSDASIISVDMYGNRSIVKNQRSLAKPFDYKKLLEKPEDGMQRISVAPKPPKASAKTKGNPKSK